MSATTMTKASLTGHSVTSTLTTVDSANALDTLRNSIEEYSAMREAFVQRLSERSSIIHNQLTPSQQFHSMLKRAQRANRT